MKEYVFNKVIIDKLKKDLPDRLELVVLQNVESHEFKEADFKPKIE